MSIRLWRMALAAALFNAQTSLLLAAITQGEHAIGLALGVSTTQQIWLAEALLVAATCALPLAPFLGGRWGPQRALIACSLILVLTSLAASQVNGLAWLIALLFLCGSAAAPLGALSQSLIVQTLPQSHQGRGLALWNGGNVLGLLLGTWGAAQLTQDQLWRPLFWLPIPLALLACLLLPRPEKASSTPLLLDGKGYLLQLTGMLSLTLGLTLLPIVGWRDPRSLLLLIGPGLLALYVRHAASVARPLLSLEALKNPSSRPAIVLAFLFAAVTTGSLESNFLVDQLQLSPQVYTLRALGQSLLSFVAVAWAARWITRAPIQGLLLALALTLLGKLGFNFFAPQISPWAALWPFFVSGFGYWMGVTLLASLAVRDQGSQVTDAAALYALALQFGATLGLAVLDASFDELTPVLGQLGSFSAVFWLQWAVVGMLLLGLKRLFHPPL